MMKKSTYKKYLSILLRIISILLIISIGLIMTYVISANFVKKSIINNLKPVINELSDKPGAFDVEVKVYAEPKSYNMPWELEFHVFLTVKFSHLAQLGDEKIMEVLNNGMELGKAEYSYGWNKLDYAIYTRSVIDSVFGTVHPVFVTLTDGDKSYTIRKDNFPNENIVDMGDAYNILNPPSVHQIMSDLIKSTIILLCLFVFIVCVKFKKNH